MRIVVDVMAKRTTAEGPFLKGPPGPLESQPLITTTFLVGQENEIKDAIESTGCNRFAH